MKFGGFILEAELGEGGTARVFRAVRELTEQPVALKLLKTSVAADPRIRQRFLREARAAGEVLHPNLIAVEEVGESDGRPYLTMPLVTGASLEEKLRATGPLEIDATVALLDQLCAAVEALHAADLVHRDIKPANVLVNLDDEAFLTDFGLARGRDYTAITSAGQMVGTLAYLAPELIRGEDGGPAADVYALGCLTYQCLTATPPFRGSNVFTLGMAVLEDVPSEPCDGESALGARINGVVMGAMSKEPSARPATAAELARQLRVAHQGDSG